MGTGIMWQELWGGRKHRGQGLWVHELSGIMRDSKHGGRDWGEGSWGRVYGDRLWGREYGKEGSMLCRDYGNIGAWEWNYGSGIMGGGSMGTGITWRQGLWGVGREQGR